jgi:hypothetical protein
MTSTDTLLVPTALAAVPRVTEEGAESIACAIHGRECLRTHVAFNQAGEPYEVRLRCIHGAHDYNASFLARHAYPQDHDLPSKYENLPPSKQDEAKAIARVIVKPAVDFYQVGRWLDAFRDLADGKITEAGLYQRTNGEHGRKPEET